MRIGDVEPREAGQFGNADLLGDPRGTRGNLKGRLEDEKLSDSDDHLHAAQVLLDMPIRRAFTAASKYIQGAQ
jgi:hypothetical protein